MKDNGNSDSDLGTAEVSKLRVGLIIPSSNTTMEHELYRMAPKGVSIHSARIKLTEVRAETLRRMAEDATSAAKLLSTAAVDLIVYGCTTGSLLGGDEWESGLTQKVRRAGRAPTFSTATAVVEALEELEAKRIVVLTPYIDELNALERKYLESKGFIVLRLAGLGLVRNLDIGKESPAKIYQLALESFDPSADAVFISCTNLRTIEMIEPLEKKLGRPVVTSNQASMWKILETGNLRESVSGYGVLLGKHL